MAPNLPTEILGDILRLVNEDEAPIERQINRQRFQLVCKGWFASVDRWTELAIRGSSGLRNARRVFEMDDNYSDEESGLVGPRVKSLYFSIQAGSQPRVAAVVERTPNLGRLVIAGRYADDVKSLGTGLPAKLGLLSKMKEFELNYIDLPADSLLDFVPHWPQLEEFTIRNGSATFAATSHNPDPPFEALFTSNTRLRSLCLGVGMSNSSIGIMLNELSSSVSHLTLIGDRWQGGHNLTPLIQAVAAQLTELVIHCPVYGLDLSEFTSLRKLRLCARFVPPSLAALPILVELDLDCLVDCYGVLGWYFKSPTYLQNLLDQSTTLQLVRLTKYLWSCLETQQQTEIQDSAARHSVELVIY